MPATTPANRPWPVRLAILGWIAIGAFGWYLGDSLGGVGQFILATLWLVGLGLLLRRFIGSLFGPVLAYDALRVGRKPRYIIARTAYALLLAGLFGFIYLSWLSFADRSSNGNVQTRDMARLAEYFFSVYMVVQFILICVVTPAAVAGAIAEEKERRTLEFLLATDLRDREILFGKLASRVGSLLLFLAAGLPILGLLQFFGGIDPQLVLAGFAATFATVLTLAALSIAASVLSKRVRDAIALTYLAAVAFSVVSVMAHVLAMSPFARLDTIEFLGYTIAWDDLTYPFVAGNPFFMVPYVLERNVIRGGGLYDVLGHYLIFHAVAIGLLLAWAGLKLRAIALRQAFGGPSRSLLRQLLAARKKGPDERSTAPAKPSRSRPELGDAPVVWKEVFVDAGLRLGGFAKLIVFLLLALSVAPAAIIVWGSLFEDWMIRRGGLWWSADRWRELASGMNAYLRVVNAMVGTLVFLAIAVRGSGAISGERDKQTMDVLLTTPLPASRIVWGKFWGCILGMRWAWAWLFGLWLLALVFGGVHPVVVPFAFASIAVYASGFAWIGLYCSATHSTTLRATMAAIAWSLLLGGGYFLVFVICCIMPISIGSRDPGDERFYELGLDILCGFSPSFNLAWLPIREFEEPELTLVGDLPFFPFWFVGLAGWFGLSCFLSRVTVRRFREKSNRGEISLEFPERIPPRFHPRGERASNPADSATRE